jgi:hypothetical protein
VISLPLFILVHVELFSILNSGSVFATLELPTDVSPHPKLAGEKRRSVNANTTSLSITFVQGQMIHDI